MKKILNRYKYISLAILLSMGVVACEDFLDVNTDGTRLKTVDLPLALTAAEGATGFLLGMDLHLYSSTFSQQAAGNGVTGNQIRQADQYNLPSAEINNAWTTFFTGPIADLNYIRQNAYLQGSPHYAGVAKILQAYGYSVMTDAWGQIPYKESMKGVENPRPVYDESKEIYDSLFVLIDSGLADIANTANARPLGNDDLIYGGVMTKWVKFANTLKLRLALHYAKDDNGAKLRALITATPATSFMENPSDNFSLMFAAVNGRTSPANQFEANRQDYYWPSAFIVNMMNAKADPRRTTYFSPVNYPTTFPFTPTPANTYVGMTPGAAQGVAASRIYVYSRGAVTADNGARTGGNLQSGSLTHSGAAPVRMLTFAEYNFIRAEAALVYNAGTAADARTFFLAGINASMDDAGLAASAATARTAYLAAATTTAATLTLRDIIEEKYVGNFMVPMEPWSDWRRTGFPVLSVTPAAAAVGNNEIPRVYVYPLSELTNNTANVPPRVSLVVKSVFWDK